MAADYNDGTYSDVDSDLSTGIPPLTPNTPLSAVAGAASSTTYISYNHTGGQTILDWEFNHTRAGRDYSEASTQAALIFTASQNAWYTLSGTYTLSGEGYLGYEAILFDTTTPQYLFRNDQESIQAPDESFTLGQKDGDFHNHLHPSSSLAGSIIAGHVYQFSFNSYLNSNDHANGGYFEDSASAGGLVTLTFSSVTSTPEPTSMALLGLASLGGIGLRWRRTRKTRDAAATA